jgi:probable HAF family extracellular repeat protein
MTHMKSIVTSMAVSSLFAALAIAQPTQHYDVKDLGPLPSCEPPLPGCQPTVSQANSVNDLGFVAGLSTINAGPTIHAVVWYPFGLITDIGQPGLGGPNSEAFNINDFGQVVGQAETSTPDPNKENFCGFDTVPGTVFECVAFEWQYGVMSPLPLLGGNNGLTTGNINNNGQVPGTAENSTRDAACPTPQVLDFEPVIWGPPRGEIHALSLLHGDTVGFASWINDNGEAVGTTGTCANSVVFPLVGGPHGLLWEPDGSVIDLGNLGAPVISVPLSINNNGQVVGASSLTDDATPTSSTDAFLWTREMGKMRDLGTLASLNGGARDVASGALSINDSGVVVGLSVDAAGNLRAFIWQDGAMTDLNTLVPADSPLHLWVAESINSSGEIAGFGMNKSSGDIHGFLLTPHSGAFSPGEPGAQTPMALGENVRQQLTRWLWTRGRLSQ